MSTRQQRYHQSMKKKGYKRVQVWVHESQVESLKAVADEMMTPRDDRELPATLRDQAV